MLITQHRFSTGEIDDVNGGNFDTTSYQNGASLLVNTDIDTLGSISKRRGYSALKEYDTHTRVFTITKGKIAVFSDNLIDVYDNDELIQTIATPYKGILDELCVLVYKNRLVISHRNHEIMYVGIADKKDNSNIKYWSSRVDNYYSDDKPNINPFVSSDMKFHIASETELSQLGLSIPENKQSTFYYLPGSTHFVSGKRTLLKNIQTFTVDKFYYAYSVTRKDATYYVVTTRLASFDNRFNTLAKFNIDGKEYSVIDYTFEVFGKDGFSLPSKEYRTQEFIKMYTSDDYNSMNVELDKIDIEHVDTNVKTFLSCMVRKIENFNKLHLPIGWYGNVHHAKDIHAFGVNADNKEQFEKHIFPNFLYLARDCNVVFTDLSISRLSVLNPIKVKTMCFHQNRLIVANTLNKPNGIWYSRVNGYGDFTWTEVNGAIPDDHGISDELITGVKEDINHLVSSNGLLYIFNEHTLYANDTKNITPNINGYYKVFNTSVADNIRPVEVGGIVHYVNKERRALLSIQSSRENQISTPSIRSLLIANRINPIENIHLYTNYKGENVLMLTCSDGIVLKYLFDIANGIVCFSRYISQLHFITNTFEYCVFKTDKGYTLCNQSDEYIDKLVPKDCNNGEYGYEFAVVTLPIGVNTTGGDTRTMREVVKSLTISTVTPNNSFIVGNYETDKVISSYQDNGSGLKKLRLVGVKRMNRLTIKEVSNKPCIISFFVYEI